MSGGQPHEAGFYTCDDEFRTLILPFVEDGLTGGEAVIIGYDERKSDLLRSWLDDPSAVTFIADRELYATPARAIAGYRRLAENHVRAGAIGVRIAGDVPHAGNGGRFNGWDRYESAVNTVWDDLPMRSMCLYDATTVSATVRDVVERTHRRVHTPAGAPRTNNRYQDPAEFTGVPAEPDPLETTPLHIELHDPTPAQARHAMARSGQGFVTDTILGELGIGLSEAVSNAIIHGRPPVTVRIWIHPGRVLIHIHDSGNGPTDHLAGLIPTTRTKSGGLGLWVTHQLDLDINLIHSSGGFTVRLRGGRLP